MQDTTQTIIRSASRFFSGTMLSRITGMLRDIAMAYAFGTQSAIAALLVAFRFAHLFRRLFGEGALQTAFIPHFEELRKESPKRACSFFSDLALSLTFFLSTLILGTMAVLWLVSLFIELSPGNSEILWLTFLMMPSLLFICLFGLNASLLQCEKSYFVPSFAPAAFNFVWILGVFATVYFSAEDAMKGLALFIVAACIAQWAITLPKTIAILKKYQSPGYWKQAKIYSQEVKQLVKPLALSILGVAASQINNALDAVFARWANSEGPAFLWYAIRLQQLPLALFGIALSGALLPPLTRALKNNDIAKYQTFLNFALQNGIYLMVPISAFLFICGDSCVNLIYGRGDFTSYSVIETTLSLWGYILGLLPMTLILILAPAFYAKGDYRTPSLAATCAMIINIALNTAFVGFLNLGAASIALATSISAWINFFWLALILIKQQKSLNLPILFAGLGKILLASSLASLITIAVDGIIWGQSSFTQLISGKTLPIYSQNLWMQLSHLLISCAAFSIALILTAIALKINVYPRFNAPLTEQMHQNTKI